MLKEWLKLQKCMEKYKDESKCIHFVKAFEIAKIWARPSDR